MTMRSRKAPSEEHVEDVGQQLARERMRQARFGVGRVESDRADGERLNGFAVRIVELDPDGKTARMLD